MLKLVFGIIGIIAIIVVANILRGLIAHKTGYSRNGGNAVADVSRQHFRAKELTKEINKKRDSFRGLPIIENAIQKIFFDSDSSHLPAKIKMTSEGVYIIKYDVNTGKYNPVWEQCLNAEDLPSFDYMNGCAFFLLIQEKYPLLYIFPNTKVDDIDYGTVEEINLILKSVGDIATW